MWDCQQISHHILTDPEESSYGEQMMQRRLEFLECQSTAPLSDIVDSSYGEKEAVAVEANLSDLKQSRHEEEKEKAVAASRRGGRIWGCICGSRGNGD
ncbi:hypothetical protein ACFX19_028734 [Malus domestica]